MRKDDAVSLSDTGYLHDLEFGTDVPIPGYESQPHRLKMQVLYVSGERVMNAPEMSLDAPFLVQLADERAVLAKSSIDKLYNVRSLSSGEYFSDSLNAGAEWTWQEMLDDIWGMLPTTETSPTLPVTPDGTPEQFRFHCISAWAAYNQVLHRLGMQIIYNPIDWDASDTRSTWKYEIAEVGSTLADLNSILGDYNDRIMETDEDFSHSNVNYAETVVVCFRSIHIGGTEEDYITKPFYSIEETTTDHTSTIEETSEVDRAIRSGTKQVIKDDLYARFTSGSATPDNDADLQARADARAKDYVRQQQLKYLGQNKNYIGIVKELPMGMLNSVSWFALGKGVVTKLMLNYKSLWDLRVDEYIPGGGQSGNGAVIEFQIIEPNCAGKFAIVEVLWSSCGYYGANYIETVYDKLGCYLVEGDFYLNDRKGWAQLMQDGASCKWHIQYLCCPEDECPQ